MERSKATKNGQTAGIIIIGDEILKGHVQDTNSHFLCKQLWQLGIKVGKIAVVSDELESIAGEVKLQAPLFDFVFTTGGIGPTHDDVTMEAVGRAFGEELAPHPDVLRFLFGEKEKEHLSNPWRKMAIIPKSSKVYLRPNDSGEISYMLMVVRNVHCYPGVPSLFRDIFKKCKDLYSCSQTRFYLKELFFSCDEDILAQPLARVQREFPKVQLGSYPDSSTETNYLVRVALESSDRELVEKAYTRLVLLLPTAVMVSARDTYSDSDEKMPDLRSSVSWFMKRLPSKRETLVSGDLSQRIHNSLEIIDRALSQYRFEEMCIAFNGGKDCTVMLDLLHAMLVRRGHNFSLSKVQVLYVVEHQPFPETEQFVMESVHRYGLELIQVSGSIRHALSTLKETHPQLKAVCMGTRYTDPYSGDLTPFSPTDSGWPSYMRVNCILNWTYSDIWLYLKIFEVPYCKLYDRGYTSLDGMHDTHPNPSLLVTHENGTNGVMSSSSSKISGSAEGKRYLPAYMLYDEGQERAGRTSQ